VEKEKKVEIVSVDYEDEEGLVDVLRRRGVQIVSFDFSFGGVSRAGGSVFDCELPAVFDKIAAQEDWKEAQDSPIPSN